ncbi:YdcH family protein [Sphingomonas sp. LY54]|uniref:YdcH family protein n=1 Tax=Sphingomonas sp. LY54 TaxID=3095343 RepID=UPI002D772CB9|nr:YdcH family protein [Sphingomonas sp. LY54]WRP29711.1 YdcH family protein [Sphingomonas sp. LY54]
MNPIIARMASVHRKLDDEIRRERKRRAPDVFRMQRLKKLKLAIKDRLYRRAGHLLPA